MYNEYNANMACEHLNWCNTDKVAKELIKKAIDNSIEFSGYTLKQYEQFLSSRKRFDKTEVKLLNAGSQSIASNVSYMETGSVCVLNYADYLKPGGLFLNGSMAQEEALCHASGLYLVLDSFRDDYERRKGTSNSGAYQETGIYTIGCPFWVNGRRTLCDVLTYAAVNYRALERSKGGPEMREAFRNVMRKRIKIAYMLPKIFNDCESVILGPWGCGVFRNDPMDIATWWKECLEEYPGIYKNVYHPIYRSEENAMAFRKVFKE